MIAEHIEILVEEASMEAFLRASLPHLLGENISFEIYSYQGKSDLLSRLGERLRGYAAWLPDTWRIVVVVDRDDDNCLTLKKGLENDAITAGLTTRALKVKEWQVVFRIAIEELEAWYFGDWEAVRLAYPRVGEHVARKAAYRSCDGIYGGTWEAFERELRKVGYFSGGLEKIQAARNVGRHFSNKRCSSPSYKCFANAISAAVAQGSLVAVSEAS